MKNSTIFGLLLVCLLIAFTAGCTSSNADTPAPAATAKVITKTTVRTVATTAATPLEISPADLSGSGDDVQSFTVTGSGLAVFTMQYTGDHNFIVWLKDGQGNDVDLLVNKIGTYSGKKSEKLTPGDYTLDVQATGPWTVSVATP